MAGQPAARQPAARSWFSTVFCVAVRTPCICTDLHQVFWVCDMDDTEFEFVYHWIIWMVWQYTFTLSGSVNRRSNREWQRFSPNNKQQKKGSKRIQMIIKMVNEFKLTIIHVAHPNPMQICACEGFTAGQKTGKSGLGHGPLGLLLAKPGAVHYR